MGVGIKSNQNQACDVEAGLAIAAMPTVTESFPVQSDERHEERRHD